MSGAPKLCPYCGRSRVVCFEPVDERFPSKAVEAYAAGGYDFVPTCSNGQAIDLTRTRWSWDRARFHPGWSGNEPTDAERRGVGYAIEASGGVVR